MASLLIDTHALLWWLDGDEQLSADARAAIGDTANPVMVSAASAWEITTKHRLGKLPGAAAVARDVAGAVASQGFAELPISLRDAERAGRLPGPHRDPFDRMLAAQALSADLELVSIDRVFDDYGVRRLW
ncbi:type II toxin-antitoxin system VapC family toxin [Amaricoccus sp.]|uniref:type II toxin-antitoxin system VapC family toxin n=1 Tax=Amaricoccus sp. TaxID=1872485 RepID=UPI001B667F27|nr:type II toxin-antitoxin system VapC family toxin [Amaricoccus sp.]MBP7240533.1 type II toxin-antitoxin system VapC family toxin [Amaricoccus sp.]